MNVDNLLPITDVENLIPQKKPFVMVDTLLEFSENKIRSAFKIVNNNLFVNNNYFLESGMVENMAQTVALHTGFSFFIKDQQAPTGYIGSIKTLNIFKLPKLNETIITEASILHEFMGVTMVEIYVFNEKEEKIASANMKTVISS